MTQELQDDWLFSSSSDGLFELDFDIDQFVNVDEDDLLGDLDSSWKPSTSDEQEQGRSETRFQMRTMTGFDDEANAVLLECAKENYLSRIKAGQQNLLFSKVYLSFVRAMDERRIKVTVDQRVLAEHFRNCFQKEKGRYWLDWHPWMMKQKATLTSKNPRVVANVRGLKAFVVKCRKRGRGLSQDELVRLEKVLKKDGKEAAAVLGKPTFVGLACWISLSEGTDVSAGDICALALIPELGLVLTDNLLDGLFICWVVVASKNNTDLHHADWRKSEALPSALAMFVGEATLKEDHERGGLIWKDGQLLGVSLGGTKAFVWMSNKDGRLLSLDKDSL